MKQPVNADQLALDLFESEGAPSRQEPSPLPDVMSFEEDVAALQVRIAKAESVRDTWRGSGMQEKYLEAYSMVEALELQLDLLRQACVR